MAKQWHMVFLWIIWYFQTSNVTAFNLDTENVLQRNGDPGSLFGFSVAFHQQLKPARKNLLLVGAPRAKHQNQVNVTGVVYKCDLTTTSKSCQPIEFDDKGFSKGINNQWMGVRVTSQGPGKNVMTCGHHYRDWDTTPGLYVPHLLTGQCYLLGDDLKVGEEERSWRRVVCDREHLTRRQKDHDWFAYCQQGHGASFAKDNTSLLFGAPGAYQWKGIVRMEVLDNLDLYSEDARETGNIDDFNPKLIPLKSNSYLGFSIDSGMALIRKGELTIVSGAPRGGYSGQVAFLKADPVAQRNLSVELVLSGPGLASSFGYDLAVVDLNGDGWDDLAVGAPQFFVKDGEVGGAVYIYINNKGRNWENIVPVQLLGHKDSMFGLAVENIGDINQDHYGDIAVGAPYEGSGLVYLYYGAPDGVNKKPAQVNLLMKLFGYSLTGNLDVDDNQYPDLAVGSLSDSIFVYSKAFLFQRNIKDKLQNIPISVTVSLSSIQVLFQKNSRRSRCFQITGQVNQKYQSSKIKSFFFLVNQNMRPLSPSCINFYCHSFSEDGVAVITPSDEDIALEITVTNKNGDDAHQSSLAITLPDIVRYSSYSTTAEKQVSCADNRMPIACDLGNPLQRDAQVTFYVMLTTSGVTLNTKLINITLQLETTSEQTIQPIQAFAKVVFELQLQVNGLAKPSQVSIGDIVKGESAIKSVDQIGNSVQYEFRITNLGRPLKHFANASLSIYWPKENSVGKWLLYLTHITNDGVHSVPCSPVDEVSPLKHVKVRKSCHSRKRREAEHKALSTDGFTFLPTKRKYKTLTCSDGLNCVEIRCPLLDLDSAARIVLHSRLWNATLAEDYSSLNYLLIVVDATLTLTNAPENIGLKPDKLRTKVKWFFLFVCFLPILFSYSHKQLLFNTATFEFSVL
uniref:Integrin alpha-6 n=1 Tax=Oreochromis niloticus TaxID=8128 RepID=A0A669DKF4_ORENI